MPASGSAEPSLLICTMGCAPEAACEMREMTEHE